jgi:hypothetical protein
MSLILSGTDGLSDVDGSASTPAIRGTDANTGIFFPAADTIAFAEGGVEQMRLNSAGDLQMNSGYGSVATAYGCRAWVNFNGTGTVAIRASGNVSSITDNSTGRYTVNFTSAMPDGNYATIIYNNADNGADDNGVFSNQYMGGIGPRLTTSVGVSSYNTGFVDSSFFHVAIFR